jgi:hypothetical protein
MVNPVNRLLSTAASSGSHGATRVALRRLEHRKMSWAVWPPGSLPHQALVRYRPITETFLLETLQYPQAPYLFSWKSKLFSPPLPRSTCARSVDESSRSPVLITAPGHLQDFALSRFGNSSTCRDELVNRDLA